MSYAIIRNEKLTRTEAKGSYVHNERRTRGHTNKDIDSKKTHLNYYLKKNELSYIKEFDRLKKENNLQGHIRSNSMEKKKPKDILKKVIILYVVTKILEKKI